MSRTVASLAIAAFAAVVSPGRARACSFAGPTPHTIDAAMIGVDQTPPNLRQPMVGRITRLDATGCDSNSECGDVTIVSLTNLATDDTTPVHKIGYRLTVIAGSGYTPSTGAFDSGGSDDTFPIFLGADQDFDFTLEMVAVDAAGNESAPQTVRVHDDTGLCSIGRRGRAGFATLAIMLSALVVAARRRRRVVVLLAMVALVSPRPARACDPAGPTSYAVDAAMVGVDQVPPELAQPEVGEISRGVGGEGCISSPKCGASGSVILTNLATDDRTPVTDIGYRVTVVGGAAPPGLMNSGVTRSSFLDGRYALYWAGGYEDDIDFTIQLVALDAAGNESAPRIVRIHDDSGGCSVGRRHPAAFTLAVVMLALAVAARRQRRRRS
jgi:hypothetical protein